MLPVPLSLTSTPAAGTVSVAPAATEPLSSPAVGPGGGLATMFRVLLVVLLG